MTTIRRGGSAPNMNWGKMPFLLLQNFALAGIPEAVKELGRRYLRRTR